MAESIVTDWLADYASLEPAELRTFAAEHEHNHEISIALFTIINERVKYPDLLHSVCQQLCSFYRSDDDELRKFTLQFVPSLIYIYLNSVAQGDKKSCRSVETLLISMYNMEVSTVDGHEKTVSFRMPVLAQASIYHESKTLHPTDLRRWEENSNKEVSWGPLQPVESLNAQNRLKIMTALLFVYNQQLNLIQKAALAHLCRAASQLAAQGFSKVGHAHRSSYGNDPSQAIAPKPLPRIPMSSPFLVELMHSVYFAMFNEFGSIAIQSVDDIHNRACYELYPEVILVSNAVRNSLHANPSGQPSDGPMGISVALTPATTTVTVSKSMITNASFRTKKLPDDIPIQRPDADPSSAASAAGSGAAPGSAGALVSISEESENDPHPGQRSRGGKDNTPKVHKVPFPAFKKSKDKEAAKNTASKTNGNVTSFVSSSPSSINVDLVSPSVPKESVTKSSHKKEKFSNRSSVVGSSQHISDSVDNIERTGPGGIGSSGVFKRHIDFGTCDMVALQSISNGGDGTGEDGLNATGDGHNNVMSDGGGLVGSMDSGADVFATDQSKRISVVDMKAHTMQVSQV